ncbi:MAG TPA: ATP-binding protein [Solirubrobacteraceae bacterium]|jgi:predicted AAA+ superfamily ATPase|nr:ATP-binding protein [Solirubrobacteraceae bacterium]
MALRDEQILAQNPWWSEQGWPADDRQLALLAGQPVRLPAELVDTIDLRKAGIHVLRGPRQVGKTTDLKLLVQRALAEQHDARSILYLTLDLLEGQPHAELAETIVRAKTLARRPGAGIVLLDEVTGIPRWQTAVKALWDDGTIAQDTVVCTGSSAIDLQKGAAERLPGRRGVGRDHLVLPQTFASFAHAIDNSIPPSPRLTIADIQSPEGQDALNESRLHAPALERALSLYLKFGGLPAAVAEAATGTVEPSEQVKRVLSDSLVKEVQRRGASMPAAHALLERVLRSLGSRTDWSRMAREMDVPLTNRRGATSHHTLRDYIELLAGGYFLFILYFWRSSSQTNNLSNEKKLYFADPLLHTIALEHAPGLAADIPALIENAVGLALYRGYEPPERLIESFISPDRLHAWRTARAGELDFVAGPRRQLDVVEVKYKNHIDLRSAAAVAKAHPGRPAVIATRHDLLFADGYALVPTHQLLWALR